MWKVIKNPVCNDYMYRVVRIIDPKQPMHSGNIEAGSDWLDSKEEAQLIADELNRRCGHAQA